MTGLAVAVFLGAMLLFAAAALGVVPVTNWSVGGLMGAILVMGLAFGPVKNRAVCVLHDHRYLLCTYCRYSLDGLGKSGNCPECGGPYTLEAAEAHWRNVYLPRNQGSEL